MTAEAATAEVPMTPWWVLLIQGIAAIVLGVLLFAAPAATLAVTVMFLGIWFFLNGVMSIVFMFIDKSNWVLKLISGVIGVLAGIVVLQHPLWSTALATATLVVLLAFGGIIMGLVYIYQAFKGAGWGTGIMGALMIVLGAWIWANSTQSFVSMPYSLGMLAIVGGILACYYAFKAK